MTTKIINNFTFICEHVNKRDGFKHVAQLYHDGVYVSDGISHWVNRTWESYTYQRAMVIASQNYMNEFEVEIIEEYKRTHGVQRLTKKVKEQLQKLFDEDKRIQEVKVLINNLNTNNYQL